MGLYFTDKYSLLHFAVGIVIYFWNITFVTWFIIHMLFEYIENTNYGIKLINNFPYWPGGKDHSDSLINNVGDHFYALLGWFVAHIVCNET